MFRFLEQLVRTALAAKDMGASMSAVVMSVACAEAYVNELGYMALRSDTESHRKFVAYRTNVEAKFNFLADAKGQSLDKESHPLKPFKFLLGLRGLIVHYEIDEEPLELEQTRLEKNLAQYFPLKEGDVSTERFLSGACANWALDTSFGMIRYLYDIGYEPPNVAWFEAFHPGFRDRLSGDRPSGTYKIRDIARG